MDLEQFLASIKGKDPDKQLTAATILTWRWNKMVEMARKRSPILPGDTERGTYSALALDAYGQLSLGRNHGRHKKTHYNKRMLTMKSYTLLVFERELPKYMKHHGLTFDKLTADDFGKVGARAALIAAKEVKAHKLADRQARRARQKNARRIGFGLVPCNRNLGTFAG
jgi:hypothetical protein